MLVGSWQSMRDERPSLYKPAQPPPLPPPNPGVNGASAGN
jgi:hypothetical protein